MQKKSVFVGFSLVMALGLSACKHPVPQMILEASGKLAKKDCLAPGQEESTEAAITQVKTSFRRGLRTVSTIVVKTGADAVIEETDVEAAIRSTGDYAFSNNSAVVLDKNVDTLTMEEKHKRAKKGDRCLNTYTVATVKTECPKDDAEAQCTSRLEVATYSKNDKDEARAPITLFQSKRTKHAKGVNPFLVTPAPAPSAVPAPTGN